MYSGLLPNGLSEADLSPDEEQHTQTSTQSDLHTATQLTQSESTSSPSFTNDQCLPGVKEELWQKFQAIQQEREIQKSKQPKIKARRKRCPRKGGKQKEDGETQEKRNQEEKQVKHWDELTQYFGANERFQPPASSRPPLKSGLEKSMERAIAEGDYGKAEELSDRLATRELAVKIAQAADCRDFAQTRQEEEESRDARKRKKQIAWGFESKKRWETKSNMGFM